MLSKIDQELSFVQTALGLRARRQEIIAANLANADTPHYKARELDFAAAMNAAMGTAAPPMTLARTTARHLSGNTGSVGAGAFLGYRSTVQPSLDGNSVDPDVERAHFADNAMHYQFLLERASSTFRTIGLALSAEK